MVACFISSDLSVCFRDWPVAELGSDTYFVWRQNAVLGKPTCLSPIIRGARESWGFRGYVTSDSDSVHDAYSSAPPHGASRQIELNLH